MGGETAEEGFQPKTGLRRTTEPFRILTEGQVEAIHQATLQVLSMTGVTVSDRPAQLLLAEHGCRVDTGANRVRFPSTLVEECVALCPSRFRVRARNPEKDWDFGNPDITYFIPSNSLQSVDLASWVPRRPGRKEFYEMCKLIDGLPTIHGHTAFPWYGFDKVPECMQLVESNAAKIRYSTKPQMEGSVLDNYRWNIEMARATNQDLLNLTNPGSPLTLSDETVGKIRLFAESDVPFSVCSGPVGGATGPATIAGLVVQNNAEFLSAVVLAQLHKAGARMYPINMAMLQDMRTGAPGFAQVGTFMVDAAFHQIWRTLGIPSATVTAGTYLGSKMIDVQAGYETAVGAVSGALSGAGLIFLHGGLTQQKVMHPVKMVLDDDLVGMIERYLKGIEVSDQTLAVDVINEVGPIPGNFLTSPHTRQWWKKEQYLPHTMDNLAYDEWVLGGRKGAIECARVRMEEILATHKPIPLPLEQEEAVEAILGEARQYYRKKGLITDAEWRLYQEDLNSPEYPYA